MLRTTRLLRRFKPNFITKFERIESSIACKSSSSLVELRTSTKKSQFTPFVRHFSTGKDTFQVKVPTMGESITDATIIEWVKQPGDFVEEDEVIAILETDKTSVDVRSPHAGVLVKQFAQVDADIKVGANIAEISKSTDGAKPPKAEGKPKTEVKSEKAPEVKTEAPVKPVASGPEEIVDITVPTMGESIVEGTIIEWKKQVGDAVNADEIVAVLETDKVSVDVKSDYSGTIKSILANVGDVVKVGGSLLSIIKGEPVQRPTEKKEVSAPASPSKVEKKETAPKKASASSSSKSTSSKTSGEALERSFTRTKLSRMRLRIAERLKESQNISASLTTFQECDMGNLMDLRKRYKDQFEKKHEVKLGFMSAFVKAAACALVEYPMVNAMIDDSKKEIISPNYVDISVAVSTDKGLVTPIIQNCEKLSFADIEKTLASLAKRARDNDLTIAELNGGTFTISNGGVFGSLMGTPILNRPQSAILGMHATKMRPVVNKKGEMVARPMMYLALTYDHRLIDGRDAVQFLKSIADKIEDPERLLLDL